MKLEELGYSYYFEKHKTDQNLESFSVGRITAEHKERYILSDADNEYEAEITGNLRFSAQERSDFPAVGDWVSFMNFDNNQALIYHIFPRISVLERQAVGKFGEKQIIAVNIDYAFIIQAVDRDFNLNRVDRYITLCNSGNITPIIVLSKIDLISDSELEKDILRIQERHKNIKIISLSNFTKTGYNKLDTLLEKGKTYCIVGSSGVGKSTLINNLLNLEHFNTNEISSNTQKGKHTTSHKELVILINGAILIDTPGMREVGIVDSTDALEQTFNEICEIAQSCKFQDCSHTNEPECAIIDALKNGEIDQKEFENYQKLERESIRAKANIAEKRKKDKEFGKMIKTVLKEKKKNKF